MPVVIAYNPRAGHGQSRRAAESLSWAVRGAGHEALVLRVGDDASNDALGVALRGAEAAVVCGGDGTLHHLLAALVRARVPVYPWPTGTENLFAREFNIDQSQGRLLGALASRRFMDCDLGEAEIDGAPARLFMLMCSIGPDAEVTRRVSASRRAGRALPGRLGFVAPALGQVLRPALARFTVRVDGAPAAIDQRGMLVVASARQYALRINPASRASMTDGLLDAVLLPSGSSIGTLTWLVRARLGVHLARPSLVYRTGATIEVESSDPIGLPVQIDGEGVVNLAQHLCLRARPGALRVLVP